MPARMDHGGRIELKLSRLADDSVEYALELSTPGETWRSVASIRLADGNVELGAAGAAPPAWLGDAARAVLRGLWRARSDGASAWPRRITRWRAEPAP